MDLYLTSVLLFFAFLAIIIYRDRKNIDVKYIILMRKTKKGIVFLDKLAKYKNFWKVLGTIGVLIAFYLMLSGILSLIEYGRLLLTRQVSAPGLSFIFPTPTSEVIAGPGYIFLPFWFWIVIIACVMVPHEVFHGILSRVEKIRVKSTGLLLLAIFPGAFVEPDEKQLKKSKLMTRLRIYAAGSFANFLVASALFLPVVNLGFINFGTNSGLLPSVMWPAYVPGPIVLTDVNSTSPAYKSGLRAGMVVTEIGNEPVKATYAEFAATWGRNYLLEETEKIKPGDNVTVVANDTAYSMIVGNSTEDPTRAYFGIIYKPVVNGEESFVFGYVFQFFYLLTWLWLLSYAIAIVNISPIYPLDGGLMVEALAEKVSKKHYKAITYAITFIMISIFFVNFVTPFFI